MQHILIANSSQGLHAIVGGVDLSIEDASDKIKVAIVYGYAGTDGRRADDVIIVLGYGVYIIEKGFVCLIACVISGDIEPLFLRECHGKR